MSFGAGVPAGIQGTQRRQGWAREPPNTETQPSVASIQKDSPKLPATWGSERLCRAPGPNVGVRSKGGLRDSPEGRAPPQTPPPPAQPGCPPSVRPESRYLFPQTGVLPPGGLSGLRMAHRALMPAPHPCSARLGSADPRGNDWTEGPTPTNGHSHILEALVSAADPRGLRGEAVGLLGKD